MADENVTTNIVVNSNFSDLITDLNRATAALTNLRDKLSVSNKQLANSISVMNRTFAETMRSTGQFSTHFVSLNTDVEKFGTRLDKGQIKLKEFFRVFNDHTKSSGGLIRQLAQQQVQLQNAIIQPLGRNAEGIMQYNVHIPRGLDLIKNKTALAKQELQILNRVMQEGANQLINWGKNTQWAGRQLTVGLTVPIAAFGKAAADAFRTADQELTRLTKVYGGVAATSTAELKKIRNEVAATAADLARSYGASFQDTIALAADIAATGKQGNELLGSIRETTRLSVLGEVDRQEAMKATLAIQTAFKQNTDELGKSINFLNAVENQTSTTLNDLVEAIPKAGPIIKGLGGSVQDLALYLTAMREGGVSASEGANALKSALGSLINPTKVANEMFMGFGINLKDIVTRNAGNVTGTILELQKALDTLDPLQKQQALEQLFGKFQFARMNALFSNLGKQGSQTLQVLDLMKASSQDLANIAGRELTQVTESASGKYRRALEGLKADLAGVGDQFLTINTYLINIVDKVINFANNLPKPIKQLLSVLGMFTAAAGPVIMLTGVLGNFIGFLVKGVFHLKALFKGGEGWRLLTPEILAANRAASVTEEIFYSDAKAASVFRQAVQGLTGSLAVLEAQLNSGVLNIAPQLTNVANGMRVVDPNHPLISAVDTRSMSHMNPFSKMSQAEKEAQTIFGVVPGAPKVNQKISASPQIYATTDLPIVPGLTRVGGVSTGVVAAEAAKWHSMTAALAMQSKAEIEKLKLEVSRTGLVTEEVSVAYESIFPKMNELVMNAAEESAKIVEAARAGKISVEQARAQIVALNAQLEQMIAQTSTTTAAGLGRTIDLQQVPLTEQPLLGPKNKVNLKEMTRPGRTRELLNKIAGALGVKTYGASYSIETTKPKKMNAGGPVSGSRANYGNTYNPEQHGAIVPGPNVNFDIIPSMVPQGGFVLNQTASRANPQLVALAARGYRAGGQMTPAILTPGETVVDPMTYAENRDAFNAANNGMNLGGEILGSKKNYGNPASQGLTYLLNRLRINKLGPRLTSGSITGSPRDIHSLFGVEGKTYTSSGIEVGPKGGKVVSLSAKPATALYGARLPKMPINSRTGKPHTLKSLNELLAGKGLKGADLDAWLATLGYMSQGGPLVGTTTQFLKSIPNANPQVVSKILNEIDDEFYKTILKFKKDGVAVTDSNNPYHEISNRIISKYFPVGSAEHHYWNQFRTKTSGLNPLYLSDTLRGAGHSSSSGYQDIILIGPNGESIKVGKVKGTGKDTLAFHAGNTDWEKAYGFNRGGAVPGYSGGGILSKAAILKKLRAKFSPNPGGRGYTVEALPMSPNTYMFRGLPISSKAKKFLYDYLVSDVTNRSPKSSGSIPFGPITQYGRMSKNIKGIGNKDFRDIWQSASYKLKDNPSLSEADRLYFKDVAAKGLDMPFNIIKGLGFNRGGKIPGGIPRYGLGGAIVRGASLIAPFAAGLFAQQKASESNIPGVNSMVGQLIAWSAAQSLVSKTLKSFTTSSAEAASGTSKFARTMEGLNIAGRAIPGWGKVAAVAIAAIATVSYGAWEKARKARLASEDAIKLDKNKVAQAGISYTSITDKIKETTAAYLENARIIRAKAAGAESIGGGVNLTVAQLKDLQKELKNTSPDLIKMFDAMNRDDVVKNVADLKAQLIAAGQNAQTATNKIFALLSLSNKQDMTSQALGSTDFKSIVDQYTSAQYSIKSLSLGLKNGMDSKELAASFDQGLVAVDSYFNSIEKVKDSTGKLVIDNEAVANTINKMKQSAGGMQKIGEENLQVLIKQKPELAGILNASDSIVSAWTKYKLYTSGVLNDLTQIDGATAEKLLNAIQSIKKSADAMVYTDTNKKTNDLYMLAQAGINAEKRYKDAKKLSDMASKDAQKTADAEIKIIDKRIQAINDEYDARKKLIELQTSKESYQISMQKEQLNYQQALANADLTGAARAQLNLRQINLEYQKTQAMAALEDTRNKKLKEQEDARTKVQERILKLQERAAALAKKAAAEEQRFNSIKIIQQNISNTLLAASMTADKNKIKELAKSLQSDVNALAKLDPKAAASIYSIAPTTSGWSTVNGNKVPVTAQDWEAALNKLLTAKGGLMDDAAKQAYKDFGMNVADFGKYVAQLLKLPAAGTTGKAYGNAQGAPTLLERKNGKWVDASGKEYSTSEASKTPQAPNKDSMIAPYQHKDYSGKEIPSSDKIIEYTDADGNRFARDGKVYKKDSKGVWKQVGIWYNETYGTPGQAGTKKVYGFADGGSVKHFGPGGDVTGPGTGTSDSIPAYLSNGEYVIRAAAVEQYGKEFFDGLNAQKFAGGGMPDIMGMGMQWFGNTLNKAMTSVVDAVTGINITKPWSEKSGMEKLSMALLPLGGEGFGVKAGSKLINPSLMNKKQYKQIIDSIYKRKNIQIGDNIFPTYALGNGKGHFAFQGFEENLSALAEKGINIVKTTPEGLLEAARSLNPKNKGIEKMLNNFKNNNIGKIELDFLDKMTAAVSIGRRGKETHLIRPDGFAMLLAHLAGDSNASKILASKKANYLDIIKQGASKDYLSNIGQFKNVKPGPINMSEVPAIHSTKFPIVKDAKGNIILHPYGHHNLGAEASARVPRASTHFTLEAPVESHMWGKWNPQENMIISTLSSMIKNNGLPANLNPTDTWWMRNPGQALKLSNTSVIRGFTNVEDYTKELVSRGLAKAGGSTPLVAIDNKTKEVLKLIKESYSEADRLHIDELGKKAGLYVKDFAGQESDYIKRIAIQFGKQQLGINSHLPKLDGPVLSSTYANDHIQRIAKHFNIIMGQHYTSPVGNLEDTAFKGFGKLTHLNANSIEAIRMLARYGHFNTNIKNIAKSMGWPLVAAGGYISKNLMGDLASPKYNIPTSQTPKINPAAMAYNRGGPIHRYDVGGLVVNAAPGMDTEMLANRVVDIMDTRNMRNQKSIGSSKVVI